MCACTSDCPHISTVLTTDKNFPIENKIAPLAFELKRLEVFKPCWSCEGHNDKTGQLWKIPRLWFYCDSVVYVRLLSDVLKDLEIEDRLETPWQVRVTFSDKGNPSTAFALEPEASAGVQPRLETLQGDVLTITECVYERMMEKASSLMPGA